MGIVTFNRSDLLAWRDVQPISTTQLILQSGQLGEKRQLADGSDRGVIVVFNTPAGNSTPVWCWDLYPNAKYEV